MIHIASVTFPCNSSYEVTVNGVDFERTIIFNSGTDKGFGISIPALGVYTLSYRAEGISSEGSFTHDGSHDFTALTNSDTVYRNVASDEITECQPPATGLFTENVSGSFQKAIFQSAAFLLWLL
jgi:hypothetical protein